MSTSNDTPQTIIIPLTKGYSTSIDPVDFDLANFKWFAVVDKRGGVYAARKLPGKPRRQQWLHKIILERILGREVQPNEQGDHIDLNTLNNHRSNIRLASVTQNLQHRRRHKSNTTGYKGVSYLKREKRWKATINAHGKAKYLGLFNTPEEAYEAYCQAAKELHGDFARLE